MIHGPEVSGRKPNRCTMVGAHSVCLQDVPQRHEVPSAVTAPPSWGLSVLQVFQVINLEVFPKRAVTDQGVHWLQARVLRPMRGPRVEREK